MAGTARVKFAGSVAFQSEIATLLSRWASGLAATNWFPMPGVGMELLETGAEEADGFGFMHHVGGERARLLFRGSQTVTLIECQLPGSHRQSSGFELGENLFAVCGKLRW